ncbi:MAG: glycoside hydrolase family 99-like domain-containing protein [Verrucomicrobiota bacterium]
MACRPLQAADLSLAEWSFDRDGDLQGWQPNAHLADANVSGGALTCRAVGADPILELRPLMDLSAPPWQAIEVRMKANREGTAEAFWSNTNQGRYGGFSQDKSTRFNVAGDNQWHSYRIFPFWHPEGKIVRLRFDVYDGATFAVDFIRIAQLPMPPPAEAADFDFTRGGQGWQPMGAAAPLADRNSRREENLAGKSAIRNPQSEIEQGLLMSAATGIDGFWLSPPLQVNADEQTFVSLRMGVDKGSHATLFFASEKAAGLHSHSFRIEADGRVRTYQVDMLSASAWSGRIIALGLRPSNAPEAKATLRWLKVAAEPQGAPQLKVVSFALEDALPRAGAPVTLAAVISSTGGEIATNVQARLTLPEGMRVVSGPPSSRPVATLGFDEEAALHWIVESPTPMAGEAELRLTAGNAEAVVARARVVLTPRVDVPQTGYVPEPKPVRGEYEVGAYYFPGWKGASEWHPIRRFPERKPVLGWYGEGSPEVADWHIKWAVEHGLTFLAYDWYWSQGVRQLEHALHDGYFKARYRHLLKFCLLWANHNAPGTSSREDCLAVTRYWIENYFRRPEHLTVDGKPVVIIFSTERLTADLGSENVKGVFEAMRAECRQAGLKGLYLVACVGGAGQARQAAAEGYDAVSAYNWPGLGMTAGEGMYAPYEALLEGYRRNWEHILEQTPIPLLLPLNGGWDSRPWHGDNNLVRFGRTPELFKRHLQDAKRFLQIRNPKSEIRNLVLVEAWNEWGEGSYIEPHQEFGFGYLEAIREVFTDASPAHIDLTPADVGLGPYDVPAHTPGQTAWDFARGDQGWDNVMQLTEAHAENGLLIGRTAGPDPAFFGPPMQARASEFASLVVRMRLQHTGGKPFKDTAQLFWRTNRTAESEASSARFEVLGDGQWREYSIPVAQNRRWRGLVTRLRLDPCNQAEVRVELDFIQLAH